MKFLKKIKKIFGTTVHFSELSLWCKILIYISLILFILIVANKHKPKVEGFSQSAKFVTKNNNNLYDDFYCSIYDDLVFDTTKNKFELDELKYISKLSKESKVLDVGCGRGHHVKYFKDMGAESIGIDKSKAMINLSKKKYPMCKYKHGDVLDSMHFKQNKFSHIVSLYFTTYYIEDKMKFFKNAFKWLKPGGHLVLHLVNRNKFDPIINTSNPVHMVSVQKYAPKRITNSIVKFKDFTYKANFEFKNNRGTFSETFKDDGTNNVRKNEHVLHMETQKEILAKAKKAGFIFHGKSDMVNCMYEYQYLYYLIKPE